MRLTFTDPVYLWFLLSIPFLIITHMLTLKYNRNLTLKFSNFEALARISREYRLAKPYLGLIMNTNLIILLVRVSVLLLVILSLSGTVLWYTGRTSEYDFVLTIDVSSSMSADDFSPSRIEAAKNSAMFFVNNISNDVGVGVVSFAGTTFVDRKITEKDDELRQTIENLDIKEVGGTNLGGALVSATNLLLSSHKYRVIILLTDGRGNVGVTIDEAIDYAKKNDIIVYTIGIGTGEGGNFTEGGLTSTLDEVTLKRIADELRGKYYRAENEEELNNAYSEIANIRDLELSVELSFIFVVIAFLLLFGEWVLLNTKYRIIS
jgi:Ca-activated chloride channel family protein